MVGKQQKTILLRYLLNARSNNYEQVFSYQIVSLAVTESREVMK